MFFFLKIFSKDIIFLLISLPSFQKLELQIL